jgi:hypothetical protein
MQDNEEKSLELGKNAFLEIIRTGKLSRKDRERSVRRQ